MIGSLGVVREHAGTGADESGRIGDLLRRSALRIEGRLEGLTAKSGESLLERRRGATICNV